MLLVCLFCGDGWGNISRTRVAACFPWRNEKESLGWYTTNGQKRRRKRPVATSAMWTPSVMPPLSRGSGCCHCLSLPRSWSWFCCCCRVVVNVVFVIPFFLCDRGVHENQEGISRRCILLVTIYYLLLGCSWLFHAAARRADNTKSSDRPQWELASK